MPITLYGDLTSGNCLKAKWTADYLGVAYDWREVGVVAGETQTPAYLARNPAGKVPLLVTAAGETLTESNAILCYLAAGSKLIPADPLAHARMLQWMFWEQNVHEPSIATRRFRLSYRKQPEAEIAAHLLPQGREALATMERHLAGAAFFVGGALTLADIALLAYTRMAGEGGFALASYPAVVAWIARVEAALGIAPYEPLTPP